MRRYSARSISVRGFTLIELSIVLVIIGLVIGSILVGQDLIAAAAIRSQITQIEKYQTAVNTFRGKYNDQLPGDISTPDATNFGFSARGAGFGQGDGNGIIQGYNGPGGNAGQPSVMGENAAFWGDLSTAKLIDGTFVGNNTSLYAYVSSTSTPNIDGFYPQAKIGGGNYIYVWSGILPANNAGTGSNTTGTNFFGLSVVGRIDCCFLTDSQTGMTVAQAYGIDKKVDDGYPQSGSVVAVYMSYGDGGPGDYWAEGGGLTLFSAGIGIPANAPFAYGVSVAHGSQYTCFDGGGSITNIMQYSIEINSGANVNCALSFKFQ